MDFRMISLSPVYQPYSTAKAKNGKEFTFSTLGRLLIGRVVLCPRVGDEKVARLVSREPVAADAFLERDAVRDAKVLADGHDAQRVRARRVALERRRGALAREPRDVSRVAVGLRAGGHDILHGCGE